MTANLLVRHAAAARPRRLLAAALPLAAALAACGRPAGGPPERAAAVAKGSPTLAASPTPAGPVDAKGRRPLNELPYTPSLSLEAMDRAANPCADLYQYSCGGWRQNNPIPPDQSRWTVYSKLQDVNAQFLWGLLHEASRPDPGRAPANQKIGDYFAACMDEAAVEAAGVQPLAADLAALDALASKEEIAGWLGRLHPTAASAGLLFGFSSEQDMKNSEEVIAYAVAGGLGLPDRDYYLKEDDKFKETRARYLEHLARMLELSGIDAAAAKAGAETVLALETALARATLTQVDKRDPYKLYHRMKVADLERITPGFRWKDYLAAMGAAGIETLNVTEPAFFREVQARLAGESLENWKTYLRWHLVRERAPYLSQALVQADFDFYRAHLRGVKEIQPRWKRCVGWVDRDLGEALGKVFVEKVFPPETKEKTLAMVRIIDEVMAERLASLPWMGEKTRAQALEKLRTVRNKIGYPDTWRDYSALDIQAGDFAGNVGRALAFETRRQLGKIGKPIDRGEWLMTAPTVNAYYNPSMNDINFPAGILLPPLFDPKMDDAPNYGNTGATIGHELIHGFDDEGSKFDARGNLREWWTRGDRAEFDKRTRCVADQYAQYTVVDDIKINSKLTLGEDVADLGGTVLAYHAWRKATEAQRLAPVDGLTPDQRFFVGFAQWACENQTPENLRLNALTNPHSPARERINGVVANMPEFAVAFSCPAGSPLVREKPCEVW